MPRYDHSGSGAPAAGARAPDRASRPRPPRSRLTLPGARRACAPCRAGGRSAAAPSTVTPVRCAIRLPWRRRFDRPGSDHVMRVKPPLCRASIPPIPDGRRIWPPLRRPGPRPPFRFTFRRTRPATRALSTEKVGMSGRDAAGGSERPGRSCSHGVGRFCSWMLRMGWDMLRRTGKMTGAFPWFPEEAKQWPRKSVVERMPPKS